MIKVNKFHYGWIIAVMTFLMMFLSLGLCNTAFNLYQVPITTSTSMSRTVFSSLLSARGMVKMLMTLLFGLLCKYIGLRNLAALGIATLAVSQIVFSFAETTPVFLIAAILHGIGAGMSAGSVATVFVTNWFIAHRGAVLGVVLASSGFGGAFFSQMVSRLIEANGWRFSMRVSAAIMITLAALLWLLLREKPEQLGYAPVGGDKTVNVKCATSAAEGLTFSQALKTPVFYLLSLCFLLIGIIDNPIYVAFPSRMSDIGIAAVTAASFVSIMSLSTASSKIACGFINDKFGALPAIVICFICNLTGLLIMIFARSGIHCLLFALIFGFSVPLENLLMSFAVSKILGRKDYSTFVGLSYSIAAAGSCMGNPLMGKCYDTFGSYDFMLYCCIGISIFVFILETTLIRRGKYE